MTFEGMVRITLNAYGNLSDDDCRWILFNMLGYMKGATDLQRMKEHFYGQVRDAAERTQIRRENEKSLQQKGITSMGVDTE